MLTDQGSEAWSTFEQNQTAQAELPELRLLSFDTRLAAAALGEGLGR